MNYTIPYGKQYIEQKDIEAVVQTLKSDFLTQGPEIEKFEKAFAKYIGADYAIAVSNGTSALHLCALALDTNKKSKVITSPITFVASANCIEYCGGEIEFCDIDPETLCLDINEVRNKLENAPKGTYSGIIPVDFAGFPVNKPEKDEPSIRKPFLTLRPLANSILFPIQTFDSKDCKVPFLHVS